MDRAGIVRQIFGAEQALIGVIHLEPLPGTPRWAGDIGRIVTKAVAEARL